MKSQKKRSKFYFVSYKTFDSPDTDVLVDEHPVLWAQTYLKTLLFYKQIDRKTYEEYCRIRSARMRAAAAPPSKL